ncbi:MAG: hypothetical protein MJA83_00345, partial [Gammaproteobacteria bacterium]|nr:hypothetical protein [Gammaproteobacteria bacterium]
NFQVNVASGHHEQCQSLAGNAIPIDALSHTGCRLDICVGRRFLRRSQHVCLAPAFNTPQSQINQMIEVLGESIEAVYQT